MRRLGIAVVSLTCALSLGRSGAGAVVRWTNHDAEGHDVWFLPVGDPASEELADGEQFEWIFETVGNYFFICRLHDGETGIVIVE